jgi:hypothetical protein
VLIFMFFLTYCKKVIEGFLPATECIRPACNNFFALVNIIGTISLSCHFRSNN